MVMIGIWLVAATLHGEEGKPTQPPAGALVLFSEQVNPQFLSMAGEAIDWPVDQGSLISKRSGERVNHIVSKYLFRDALLHVEFRVAPSGEGNSGVYIHGHYEMQIFNSYGKPSDQLTEHDQGALYGFGKPLVNASKPVGEWQSYDIEFRAPRRNSDGHIVDLGSVSAKLNGQIVQSNIRFGEPRSVYHPFRYKSTPFLQDLLAKSRPLGIGPVFLQDHDSPAAFRNVWIVPLDDLARSIESVVRHP
jgi:hypothetical protein